jgi:very-short-patch-repair endonuclease
MPETHFDRQSVTRSEADQVRAGLEQIRLRLLDLTSRNKLLSFRHTRSTLRVVGADLDKLYEDLLAGQKLSFLHLPEPSNEEISIFGEKPPAKQYAERLGWGTSYDLPFGTGKDRCLPILHYKDDFETLIRKIGSTARTAEEESGVNLLHLIFGFLEWTESDDSTQVRHAPLLALPVQLISPKTKDQDRSVKIQYTGDDLNANLSLVEKMRRDFNIDIPLQEEDETPQHYFQRFDQILDHKRDWRISRQVSLGLLSFGKLLMYLDLDADRWPKAMPLDQHPRLIDVFAKRGASELEFASEYEIDEEEKKGPIPPIVCEADSSQHSALVDAARGKNLVIEGPPGTGKSQTITNLIAAFLGQGKRILFVAEKMAALEVVKRRLDQYGLGEFCLELHSHKTSKVGLLRSLEARINAHPSFGEPTTLNQKQGLLASRREELTKYVGLLNNPFAAIGQSPFELIWHREQVRCELPPEILDPQAAAFPKAHEWDFSTLHEHRDKVGDLQAHFLRFKDAGGFVDRAQNQWAWLPPCHLDQSEQKAFLSTLSLLRNAYDRQRALLAEFYGTFQKLAIQTASWPQAVPGWLNQIVNPDASAIPALFRSLSEPANELAVDDFVRRKELYVEMIASLPSNGEALLDTDVPERIERAIRELLDIGLRQFSLKELQEIQHVLADVKEQCTPAGRVLAEIASTFDIQASFSVRCLTDLITARELLQKAPLSILHLRDKKFEREGLLSLLAAASRESEELGRRRDATAIHFLIDSSSSADELEDAASVIESTSWLKRWFSSRYKQAVLLFVSHCNQPHKATRHKMATSLKTIAQCKHKLARFANRDDLKVQLGADFHGIETAWGDLMNLALWYDEVLVRLPEHRDFTSKLRSALLGLPAARLKGILTAQSSALPKAENLKPLLESLEDLHALLPHVAFERSDAPVDVFLASADRTATKGEIMLATVRSLGLSSETDSTSLLQIVASVRSARTLRSSITGDKTVGEIIGNAYDGIATETLPLKLTLFFVRVIHGSSIPKELKGWLLTSEFEERKAWLQEWAKQCEGNSRVVTSLEQDVIKSVGTESILAKDWSVPALDVAVGVFDKCLAAQTLLPMWIDVQHAAQRLSDRGLHYLAEIVTNGNLPLDKMGKAFDYFFYDSLVRKIFNENPELWRLTGTSHEETRRQFCDLDKAVIELTRLDIAHRASRKKVPAGIRGTVVKETTDLALVYHEINKQKKHIPIRQLMLRACGAIQALKPCFMMSPMSVAQFLTPGQLAFDLIVMDEASQLRPEDALGAVARGSQLVVVGDPKQLPPTSFFQRTIDDEDDDEEKVVAAEGESILDIALGQYQPVRRLRWHYRSQHHSLIAFSNEEFYGGDLVVFPSAYHQHDNLGVKHIEANGIYENRRNPLEAERVVDAIVEHIAIHPEDSLGVVTMNFEQRELIEELLDARLRDDSFSSAWIELRETTPEPFFIKNLENVQGDERDAIFISVTYGRDPKGNIFQRFTGVNTATGYRRLNVLITRAKKRTVVFSSLDPDLIQTTASSAWGVRALKGYLNYAKNGISSSPEISPGAEPSNEHEAAIGSVLKEHGYDVVPQVGVSGYFIDLAVRHPHKPGVFLLGIEFDGKSYHSGRSARDRDRLRQMTLVNQGWAIHRIWSTDWFKNRNSEVDRLLKRVRSLV